MGEGYLQRVEIIPFCPPHNLPPHTNLWVGVPRSKTISVATCPPSGQHIRRVACYLLAAIFPYLALGFKTTFLPNSPPLCSLPP
jgi:hypothetical protein